MTPEQQVHWSHLVIAERFTQDDDEAIAIISDVYREVLRSEIWEYVLAQIPAELGD